MSEIRYITSVVLIAVVVFNAHAQPAPNMWAGVHCGVDVGRQTIIPAFTSMPMDPVAGIAAGGEFDYYVSENLGFCLQLSYVQKGGATNQTFTAIDPGPGGPVTVSDVYKYSYLQLPVLFKAVFGSQAVKTFLFVGPEIGLKLSAKIRETTTSSTIGQDTTADIPDSLFTSFNIGLLFGAGISYDINRSTQLYLSAAYDFGLTNLNAQVDNSSSGSQKIYTRDVRVSVGVLLGFGGKDSFGKTPGN